MKQTEAYSPSAIAKRSFRIAPGESWMALLFLWGAYAIDAISRQMIFFVLPSVTKEFSLTAEQAGFYTTIITISTAALAVPAMIWADKGGQGWKRKYRHLPMVLGYALFTALTGIDWLTGTIGLVVLWQVLSHMFGGVAEPMEVASAAEWWSKERLGLAMGLHHTGFPWGGLIGGVAVSYILAYFGDDQWRLAFLLFPIPAVVLFSAYWMYATRGRYERMSQKLRDAGETPPLATGTSTPGETSKGALPACLKNPNVSVIALVSVLAVIGYFGISFWLPQYLAFVAHYNFAEAAAYSVLFTITGGLGQIFWGSISDKLGRKLTLIILFAWLAVGMWLFQFSSSSLTALIAIQLIAGFAMNAPYTLVYAIAFDSAKPGTSGVAGALISAGIYLGGIGPYFIGALISAGGGFEHVQGYDTALYFLAFLMAAAAVLTAFFTRETAGWFLRYDWAFVSRRSCNVKEP